MCRFLFQEEMGCGAQDTAQGMWLLGGREATARHTGVPWQLAACRYTPGKNPGCYLKTPLFKHLLCLLLCVFKGQKLPKGVGWLGAARNG